MWMTLHTPGAPGQGSTYGGKMTSPATVKRAIFTFEQTRHGFMTSQSTHRITAFCISRQKVPKWNTYIFSGYGLASFLHFYLIYRIFHAFLCVLVKYSLLTTTPNHQKTRRENLRRWKTLSAGTRLAPAPKWLPAWPAWPAILTAVE